MTIETRSQSGHVMSSLMNVIVAEADRRDGNENKVRTIGEGKWCFYFSGQVPEGALGLIRFVSLL